MKCRLLIINSANKSVFSSKYVIGEMLIVFLSSWQNYVWLVILLNLIIFLLHPLVWNMGIKIIIVGHFDNNNQMRAKLGISSASFPAILRSVLVVQSRWHSTYLGQGFAFKVLTTLHQSLVGKGWYQVTQLVPQERITISGWSVIRCAHKAWHTNADKPAHTRHTVYSTQRTAFRDMSIF